MKKIAFRFYNILAKSLSERGIERIIPFKPLENIIVNLLKSDFVEIDGQKMHLDKKDSLRLSIKKTHEPFETALFNKEVRPGDIVLDIGAHIGYFTLRFAKKVGNTGKVFAFEPDPESFAILKKNVELNGYKNVILVNKAVSDRNARLKLYLSEYSTSDNRLYESEDTRNSVEVDTIRMDDYFTNKQQKVDFIKMDIQGSEANALRGMPDILKNNKLKLSTEFWPIGLKQCGSDAEEYLNVLVSYGFKLYKIDKENKIDLLNIPEILTTYTLKKGNFTTIYCVKKTARPSV